MLTYHLKPHDRQPLYEQLYHAVRADIMSGALPGGTRLPSKRQLAANLRVSQITVAEECSRQPPGTSRETERCSPSSASRA